MNKTLKFALAAGALGVCLSGKGPAVAAFSSVEREAGIAQAWSAEFPAASIFHTAPTATGILTHKSTFRTAEEASQ